MYEDYLNEDPELQGQKYVCISILTNNSIKDFSGNPVDTSNHAKGIKIRGVYSTIEEAKKRCDQIRKFDPYFNVFVGEVGKWLPWDDDAEKAEDQEYAEEKLNQIMKTYKEQQIKAKEFNEFRKQQEIENAIKLAQNKKKTVEEDESSDSEPESKEKDINEIEEKIKIEKEDLNEHKTEINEKQKNINKINEELEKARKLFEEMNKKINQNKK